MRFTPIKSRRVEVMCRVCSNQCSTITVAVRDPAVIRSSAMMAVRLLKAQRYEGHEWASKASTHRTPSPPLIAAMLSLSPAQLPTAFVTLTRSISSVLARSFTSWSIPPALRTALRATALPAASSLIAPVTLTVTRKGWFCRSGVSPSTALALINASLHCLGCPVRHGPCSAHANIHSSMKRWPCSGQTRHSQCNLSKGGSKHWWNLRVHEISDCESSDVRVSACGQAQSCVCYEWWRGLRCAWSACEQARHACAVSAGVGSDVRVITTRVATTHCERR